MSCHTPSGYRTNDDLFDVGCESLTHLQIGVDLVFSVVRLAMVTWVMMYGNIGVVCGKEKMVSDCRPASLSA